MRRLRGQKVAGARPVTEEAAELIQLQGRLILRTSPPEAQQGGCTRDGGAKGRGCRFHEQGLRGSEGMTYSQENRKFARNPPSDRRVQAASLSGHDTSHAAKQLARRDVLRDVLEDIQQPVDERHQLLHLPLHHGRDSVEKGGLLAHFLQQLDAGADGSERIA
jgi:hypothetical protein